MKCSTFSTSSGVRESFLAGMSENGVPLAEALGKIAAEYLATLHENGLDVASQQFMRIYLSDIVNDEPVLLDSELYQIASKSAFSVIEQSPLGGAAVGILVYHISSDDGSFKQELVAHDNNYSNQTVVAKGKHYALLWTSNGIAIDGAFDSYKQSQTIFTNLSNTLDTYSMSIRNNTIRTWLFVRDVDNHYKGMVAHRRGYFESIGLTKDTRYIASTGINGQFVNPQTLVSLDALSVQNIREEQIVRMTALDNMPETIVYGVTFERGFRIRYGDRSHLYISGTASIDAQGNTVYLSDVRKQTVRTIDNMEALLLPHGAVLGDMKYIIIYLRNRKHWHHIQDIIASRIPESVVIMPVEAAVCRPNWLVEFEGVGILPDSSHFPPFA